MTKKILIIDDSQSIREMISFTLENEGHTVVKAYDAFSALEECSKENFDIILTDLHMPKMTGVQLIREIRKMENYKYTPILFLTTESDVKLKQEAKEAGANGWIVKPFVPEKLIFAINKVCT